MSFNLHSFTWCDSLYSALPILLPLIVFWLFPMPTFISSCPYCSPFVPLAPSPPFFPEIQKSLLYLLASLWPLSFLLRQSQWHIFSQYLAISISLALSLAVVSNIHTAVATTRHLVLSSMITGDAHVQQDQGTRFIVESEGRVRSVSSFVQIIFLTAPLWQEARCHMQTTGSQGCSSTQLHID